MVTMVPDEDGFVLDVHFDDDDFMDQLDDEFTDTPTSDITEMSSSSLSSSHVTQQSPEGLLDEAFDPEGLLDEAFDPEGMLDGTFDKDGMAEMIVDTVETIQVKAEGNQDTVPYPNVRITKVYILSNLYYCCCWYCYCECPMVTGEVTFIGLGRAINTLEQGWTDTFLNTKVIK